MNQLIEHAKEEFRIAGWTDADGKFEDDVQEAICIKSLELLRVLYLDEYESFAPDDTIYIIDKYKQGV